MFVVHHKFRGFLSDNEIKGQYYSEKINDDTLMFDTENEANLLCDTYETPIKIDGK